MWKVRTDIPYGNACDIEVKAAKARDEVRFAADPHGGPECLWFCFRLERRPASRGRARRLRLVLKHPNNMLGGGTGENMRPVLRAGRRDWERLGPGATERLPDGRRTIGWDIPAPSVRCDVAFCYPYGPQEIEQLCRQTHGCWRADTIGVSQAGRPLVRLSNGYGAEGSDRPGLYLVARQHSGETPGSWVLDGFLRHVARQGDAAPLVWCVPLANIDGVLQGDYGKDNFPYDLNRAWGQPAMRHETLVIQRDMRRWQQRCRPALGADFHAPGACEADGAYVYLPEPGAFPKLARKTKTLAAHVREALGPRYAAADFARVARYRSRWETPSFSTFCRQTGFPALTLETPYAMAGRTILTREAYRDIGARVARAVLRRVG